LGIFDIGGGGSELAAPVCNVFADEGNVGISKSGTTDWCKCEVGFDCVLMAVLDDDASIDAAGGARPFRESIGKEFCI
jgi:hypothetical protein